MKSRAVALVVDPAGRIRTLLIVLLWLGALALAVAALLSTTPTLSLAAPAKTSAPAPTPAPVAAASERYSVAGDQVVIYNLAGHVDVVAGTGPDVVVEVRRGGHDAGMLKVESGPIGGKSTLRVIYPKGRIIYPEGHAGTNHIHVSTDGTFGHKGMDFLGHEASVDSHGSGTVAWADLRVLVPSGHACEVRLAVGAVSATGTEGPLTLDIYAGSVSASKVRGALSIDTGSGGVDVNGLDGDLNVDTGSGGVRLSSVRGKNVHVDTGSGSVTGSDVTCADLLVDTGSGEVVLEKVATPRIKVDTGSGGVTLGLLQDVENVLVDTGSGGVTLRVPPMLGAVLEVDTGSGGIDSQVPLTSVHKDDGELHGVIGDGNGRIMIDTGSGGVKLLKP
jgi:lia operon protein LiaG